MPSIPITKTLQPAGRASCWGCWVCLQGKLVIGFWNPSLSITSWSSLWFCLLVLKKKKKLTLHLLSKRLTKMSSDKNSAFKKKSVSSEIGITAFKKPVAILGPMKFCFLRMCPFPAPSPHHLVPWDPSAFFLIYSFLPTSPDILMKRENCLGQSRKAFLY